MNIVDPCRRIFKLSILFIYLSFAASCSYLPEDQRIDEYQNLQKETGNYMLLHRGMQLPGNALIFVPGGLVDSHVYLCWMDRMVEMYPDLAIISLKIPSNLAILNQGAIDNVLSDFPEINHWAIGGHSLGGVVAAAAVNDEPEQFDALLLLASFTTDYADLHSWSGSVISIYASNDGLSEVSEIEANMAYLPEKVLVDSIPMIAAEKGKTIYYLIEGANHSGFACYGPQKGDGESDITPWEQQSELIDVLKEFLGTLWI
ncbi:alpha/beta hydrolase [Bacteroidota bacterium]